VAEDSPEDYFEYLKERRYTHFIAGKQRVDLNQALRWIAERYKPKTILVDSGRGLTNAMLDRGLVDEISLLVLPAIVGKDAQTLFAGLERPMHLVLKQAQSLPGGYAHFLYQVINN
jgi:riboflavin biosynthesis pyrimidine reductase